MIIMCAKKFANENYSPGGDDKDEKMKNTLFIMLVL